MIISEEKLDKPGNLDKSINSGSSWKDQETLHVQKDEKYFTSFSYFATYFTRV